MASKPIERYVHKQIAEQGGWDRILERIGSGESISSIAGTFYRTDGNPISFAFFSRLLHQDPTREPAIREAKRLRAEAWADRALAVSDTVPADRDAVAKARVQIETRLRLAGLADREQYGERKQDINVQVNTAELHLSALRHHTLTPSQTIVVEALPAGIANRAPALTTSTTGAEQDDTRARVDTATRLTVANDSNPTPSHQP